MQFHQRINTLRSLTCLLAVTGFGLAAAPGWSDTTAQAVPARTAALPAAPKVKPPEVIVPVPGPDNPNIAARKGVPQTVVSPMGKKLALKFDDEFNAVTDKDGQPYIDRSKWITTFWQGSSQRSLFANVEAEYYMDKDYGGRGEVPKADWFNPFSFDTPGILTISATKVPQQYWHNWWMGEQRPFSSGLLDSDGHFTFEHGYIEGRFKLPPNRGAWPAFWLLGDNPTAPTKDLEHEWGPEVDVFEFFGHRPTKHTAGVIGRKGEHLDWHFGFDNVGYDLTKDFHTWGFEWDATQMVWTLDGKIWARGNTPTSMDRPMYILVNLAVGGQWYSQEMTQAGTPHKPWEVDESTMPWKMYCDYVRVYQ